MGRKVATGLAGAALAAHEIKKHRARSRSRSSSVESRRRSRSRGFGLGRSRSRGPGGGGRVEGMAKEAAMTMAGAMMEKRRRARSMDAGGRRRGPGGGIGRDIAYKVGEAVAGLGAERARDRRY